MSKPDLVANAGIYRLTWPEHNIAIRADRIYENSHFIITGELLIQTTLPGVSPHLHQARMNLTSTAARATLAKALTARLELDWYAIIEQACVMVLEHHRQGEPVVEMGTVQVAERQGYLVEPLLLENQANMLYGPGGIGKSLLGTYLGVLVAQERPVLFLDYETSAEETQDHIARIRQGLGVELVHPILYRFCAAPLASDIAEIQRLVLEHNIQFIVVDSVGPAIGAESQSEALVIPFFNGLRSLRQTVLCIDHVTKDHGRTKGVKGPYGNVYKWNRGRNLWEMRISQEPEEDQVNVGLYHRKINQGKLRKPFGFTISFTEDAITFKRQDPGEIPGLDVGVPVKDRLVAALRHGAKDIPLLAEETELSEAIVKTTLYRGQAKGIFSRLDKKWALPAPEIDGLPF